MKQLEPSPVERILGSSVIRSDQSIKEDQVSQPTLLLDIAILGSRGFPSTYGGFETFVRQAAPWLVDRGHRVTVYARGGSSRSVSEIDGVQVVATRGFSAKSASTVTHGFSGAMHAGLHKPDVVLALNVANGLALPLLKTRGIPVAVNVDGLEWERDKWGKIARRGFRAGAKSCALFADELIADSKEVARVWSEDFGVTPTFIPYGADIVYGAGDDKVRSLGLEPGTYALAVARLAPENNIELFVDAMASLNWTIPTVVVGSANYSNPLESRLRVHDANGEILWLGHVSDQELLGQLWANAGVYFHGHSVGGTNPALLQALGYGAPTLAVDTPYSREVLGGDRQLVAASPEVVSSAIQQLIGDQEKRAEFTALGRARIEESYQWTHVMESYESLLLRIANSK